MKEGGLPKKKERKKIIEAIEHNKNLMERVGEEKGGYPVKENEWLTYNSSLDDFVGTFYNSLPENFRKEYPFGRNREILAKYIEKILSEEKKHDLSAVEFGGPGSELFRGFTNNFFKITIGVCLKDIREQNQEEKDKKNNHFVIKGDIMDPTKKEENELLKKVRQTLGTDKTNLIISRMEGALRFINTDPAIMDRIIRNWYSMLEKKGLMFVQFSECSDSFSGYLVEQWAEQWAKNVEKKCPGVEIQVHGGVLRLYKKEDAPEELPPATQLFLNRKSP